MTSGPILLVRPGRSKGRRHIGACSAIAAGGAPNPCVVPRRQAEACSATSQVLSGACVSVSAKKSVVSLFLLNGQRGNPVAPAPPTFLSHPFLQLFSLSLPERGPASSHSGFWSGMKELLSA